MVQASCRAVEVRARLPAKDAVLYTVLIRNLVQDYIMHINFINITRLPMT